MNEQHTPGPWMALRRSVGYVILDGNGDGDYQGFASFVRAGSYEWQIYGEDWDFGRKHSGPQSNYICANARLIAAAPELLDALKETEALCRVLCAVVLSPRIAPNVPDGVLDKVGAWLRNVDAQAVIAKAEGK